MRVLMPCVGNAVDEVLPVRLRECACSSLDPLVRWQTGDFRAPADENQPKGSSDLGPFFFVPLHGGICVKCSYIPSSKRREKKMQTKRTQTVIEIGLHPPTQCITHVLASRPKT